MTAALVGFAVRSGVVSLLAGLATLACRRLGAAYRHLIWTAGFSAILVLPLLQAILPGRALPIFPANEQQTAASTALRLPVTEPPLHWHMYAHGESHAGDPQAAELDRLEASLKSILKHRKVSHEPVNAPTPNALSTGTPPSSKWPQFIPAIWLMGVLACLGQHLISLAILARSARMATPLDGGKFAHLAIQAGVRRPWTLIRDGAAGPRTWGVLHPTVAIPESSLGWPLEQLDAVLLHELAHVRRLDSLAQSLATIACALNWFNPLVWIGAKQARTYAERAADDAVLSAGVKPSVYAEALVQTALATKFSATRFLSAGVPLMKQSKIEARIKAILSHRRQAREVSPIGIASTAIVALALAAPCAALSATSAEPQSPVLEAVEVTHAATAAKAPAQAPKHKAQFHAPSPIKDSDLRAQVRALKNQLAMENAQLEQMRQQILMLRQTQVAEMDQHRRIDPMMLIESEAKRQNEKLSAETDMKVRQAEIAAKKAQYQASKESFALLNQKIAAGVVDRSQEGQAQADLATREADVQVAEARLEEARARLKAAMADPKRRFDGAGTNSERRSAIGQKLEAMQLKLQGALTKLKRETQLHDQGAISSEELDEATANVKMLQAQIAALKAQADAKRN